MGAERIWRESNKIDSTVYRHCLDIDKCIWIQRDRRIFFIFPLDKQNLKGGKLRLVGLKPRTREIAEFKLSSPNKNIPSFMLNGFDKLINSEKTVSMENRLQIVDEIESSLGFEFKVVGPPAIIPFD